MPVYESKPYQELKLIWRGVAFTVRHYPDAFPGFYDVYRSHMTHTEIMRDDGLAMPISETGCKSLYSDSRRFDDYEDILDYVRQWMDHAAQSKAWKKRDAEQRQLKLF